MIQEDKDFEVCSRAQRPLRSILSQDLLQRQLLQAWM